MNSATGQTCWVPEPRFPQAIPSVDDHEPVSELPGTVVDVRVGPADRVEAGESSSSWRP